MDRRKIKNRSAFTITELLTVMSIIVILISLLVPGLQMAKKYAKKVQQKTQFKGISNGLEMFAAENDGYPDSGELSGAARVTVGAQRLAEALIGRDRRGFDPASSWDAAADNGADPTLYGVSGTPANVEESLDRRKGPYLDQGTEAFQVGQLWDNGAGGDDAGSVYTPTMSAYIVADNVQQSPVLTDVYRNKRVRLNVTTSTGTTFETVKAGTPILYFRAKAGKHGIEYSGGNQDDLIYNLDDNIALLDLGTIDPANPEDHRYETAYTEGDNYDEFYDDITNPYVPSSKYPFNPDSYILMSAGFDGVFGTADDVTNFSY